MENSGFPAILTCRSCRYAFYVLRILYFVFIVFFFSLKKSQHLFSQIPVTFISPASARSHQVAMAMLQKYSESQDAHESF